MTKNKWFLNGSRGSGRTIRLLCETYENKIADLEKENAELKEINTHTLSQLNLDNGELIIELTKAKKLLNEFLDFEASCMERGIYISDKIRTEAKQFLSEVEK